LEADSQRVAGWAQLYAGRPRDSLATLRETFAFSQQIENLWGEAESAWRLASALLEVGQYGEAIRMSRKAAEQVRRVGPPTMVLLALSTWGAVQRAVMALESARGTLSDLLDELSERSLSGFADWALAELCAVHALAGDWDQACVYARRTLESREDPSLLPMGLTGWYETEALLRGGEGDLARVEVERLGKTVKDQKRFCIPWLRSKAVLAQWDRNPGQSITHLQAALALAQEIGLPGEEWSILGALAALYEDQGDQAEAQHAWRTAADILLILADTIEEEEMRSAFLEAEASGTILKKAGR
jgi:tetratricopeptide (TPR) repeat protein